MKNVTIEFGAYHAVDLNIALNQDITPKQKEDAMLNDFAIIQLKNSIKEIIDVTFFF